LVKGAALVGGWRIRHERAPAGTLHAASAAALTGAPVERTVTFMTAGAPALVLGSHQDEGAFDLVALERNGIELARRRSGGSAVLVGAGRVSWVDFVIPSSDPLWDDDVGRAAIWVGELWAQAIAGADVWRRPMRRTDWSPVVCFAGLAPGEVTVGGRKVVGVCQRRTPAGALFQTAALIDWQPADYLRLLAAPVGDESELAEAATGLGAGRVAAAESAIATGLMP
jgi:lipoate-protein ligase A